VILLEHRLELVESNDSRKSAGIVVIQTRKTLDTSTFKIEYYISKLRIELPNGTIVTDKRYSTYNTINNLDPFIKQHLSESAIVNIFEEAWYEDKPKLVSPL